MKPLLLLLSLLPTLPVFAQRQDRPSSSHHNNTTSNHNYYTDNDDRSSFISTLHTIETIADVAYMLYHAARSADYTGVRVGFNSATLRMRGDLRDRADANALSGFNGGFVFGYQLGKSPVAIEWGLYYSGKGGNMITSAEYAGNGIEEYDYRMHMFEIPLVFKYSVPLDQSVHIQPFLGGFFSWGGGKSTDIMADKKFDTFSPDSFRNIDAGLRSGVGLEISHFYLEAVYDLGFTNLPASQYRDFDFNYYNTSDKLRSGTLSLNVGLNF